MLTRIFAVIGIIATLCILAFIGFTVYLQAEGPTEPDSIILGLNFDHPIVEQADTSALDLAVSEDTTSLLDILHAIDAARADPHVKGIVARFGTTLPKLSQAQEIRAALARFRKSGKFTYAFGSSYGNFGPGNAAYYLASGFENIWLQPVGVVGLTNSGLEAPFIKTALAKIGVAGDFMKREEYKSFDETFMRDDFSQPARENMQALIEDLSNQVAAGVAEGRGWDAARVKELMAQGPFTANEALKNGLVTHLGYASELKDELKKKAGAEAKQVGLADYLNYGGGGSAKPKAHVALIYGSGLITSREVGPSNLTSGEVMTAGAIADAFNTAADDDNIKAVIFRVDSPGGEPDASETIRAAMIHAEKKGKPVFVSMGGTAASGGYWVAMSADHITAEPGTITGSIGVVAGKFVLGGLMDKIGVHWDAITTGDNAGMFSLQTPFDMTQRARMNALLDETYQDFIKDVSDSRRIPIEKMPDIAKGRVWTGAQAQKLGLVDDLGGYDVTFAAVRKKLVLEPEDQLAIELLPPPLTPAEKILKLLKNFGVESAFFGKIAAQLQNFEAVISPLLSGFHGPVTARAPSLLVQ